MAVLAPWGSPKLPSGRTSVPLCREYFLLGILPLIRLEAEKVPLEFWAQKHPGKCQLEWLILTCCRCGSSGAVPGVLRCPQLGGTGTLGPHAGGATALSPPRAAPPVGTQSTVNSAFLMENSKRNPREWGECRGQEQQGHPGLLHSRASLPNFLCFSHENTCSDPDIFAGEWHRVSMLFCWGFLDC